MIENNTRYWYAVFVPTGQEDSIKRKLEINLDNTFKMFVPKRDLKERRGGIWYQVTRTLFPGYILINGNIDIDNYRKIKKTFGIIKLLEDNGEPLTIPTEEIEILSKLIKDDEIIRTSDVLIEGKKVTVIDGPLLLYEGIIESVNKRKGRIKVRLNFLGEKRSVELGINVVEVSE